MYSAILLAGYNNKKAVEKYSKIVEKDYGEHFIETGYKPLHEFTIEENGILIKKPLIQFTLEVLVKDKLIDEIIIVGHVKQIKDRLKVFLQSIQKSVIFVDQNDRIPTNVVETFSINLKETHNDSVGGNLIKGYAASRAYENKTSALFVASDSPMTTEDFINSFIDISTPYLENSGIILPTGYTNTIKDKLGRKPLLLINDTDFVIHEKKDKYGRNGFRLTSVIMCNPFKLDINMINVIYSLRKAINIKTQMRIFKACKEVGFPGIYNRYFIKKNLTITQSEKVCSAFFKGLFKAIPMSDLKSTYDFDGTEKEFNEINKMLKE